MSALRNYSEPALSGTGDSPVILAFPTPATAATPPRRRTRIKARVRDNWIRQRKFAALRSEVEYLLANPEHDRDRHGQRGWREVVAVLAFLSLAPFRATAAGQLTWGNVLEEDGWAFVSALDKGGRETEKEIDPEHWAQVKALLRSICRSADADAPLFGRFLNRDQISARVERGSCQLFGLRPGGKRYTAHSLRHSFACNGAERTVDSALLAKQLGHSIETFLEYYAELPTRNGCTLGAW